MKKGLPSLLAALGLVGVVFALLSFLIVLFSGAGLSSDLGWIGTNLTVGAVLLVSSAAMNFEALRERMASGEARRAGKYGTSAIASMAVGIAILGMLGFLATRYHERFDWTEQKVHTLSDQSQKVLAGLTQDVDALALVSKVDADPVKELLDKYAYASDRFKVEYADPNQRPGLLEKYHISPDQLGHGLVRIAIGKESVEVKDIDEQNVTNAMVKLTRTGTKVVYFVEGHNEKPFEGDGSDGRSGFAQAAQALRNENYQVKKLLLAAQGAVPDDADVVVLAGPTRSLLDVELDALQAYLARGGSVLAMVDPRVKSNLVDRLASWGVTLGNDVVVDRALALFGRAMTPFAGSYAKDNPITRDLHEPAMFHEVRSVTVAKGGPGKFEQIVFTGGSSWAERNLARLDSEGAVAMDDGDLPGPVSVAVAGTPAVPRQTAAATPPATPVAAAGKPDPAGADDAAKPGDGDASKQADGSARKPRLVVFGDSDFASNEFIDAYRDRDLFVNSVNWLMGDVKAISVRPNRARASRFQLTADQFRTIRSLSLFVLPEAIAVLGVVMWWSRRQPGSA